MIWQNVKILIRQLDHNANSDDLYETAHNANSDDSKTAYYIIQIVMILIRQLIMQMVWYSDKTAHNANGDVF